MGGRARREEHLEEDGRLLRQSQPRVRESHREAEKLHHKRGANTIHNELTSHLP